MTERDFRMPDTLLPLPIDLDRVEDAVDELGYQFLASDDRLIMPWPNHRVSVYFGRESGLHLTALARMRRSLDLSTINEIATALNTWNAERIGPATMLHMGDLGEVEIQFRTSLSVDEGISTDQLLHFLQLTMDTITMSVDSMLETFSELALSGAGSDELRTEQDEDDLVEKIRGLFIPPPVSAPKDESDGMASDSTPSDGSPDEEEDFFSSEDSEDSGDFDDIWDDPSEPTVWESAEKGTPAGFSSHPSVRKDGSEYPREVSLNRIREHLADIGVVKTSGEEDFIVAWINEVFLGFFVDNGPTFLVKGHWDPDMDPERDFMKLFMMCNQWNEHSLTTKAFCHKDSKGLQVRVEFSVPVAEGLTDVQLRHNIALSIHHILRAVDSLSTEATGTSVVDWPEKS